MLSRNTLQWLRRHAAKKSEHVGHVIVKQKYVGYLDSRWFLNFWTLHRKEEEEEEW